MDVDKFLGNMMLLIGVFFFILAGGCSIFLPVLSSLVSPTLSIHDYSLIIFIVALFILIGSLFTYASKILRKKQSRKIDTPQHIKHNIKAKSNYTRGYFINIILLLASVLTGLIGLYGVFMVISPLITIGWPHPQYIKYLSTLILSNLIFISNFLISYAFYKTAHIRKTYHDDTTLIEDIKATTSAFIETLINISKSLLKMTVNVGFSIVKIPRIIFSKNNEVLASHNSHYPLLMTIGRWILRIGILWFILFIVMLFSQHSVDIEGIIEVLFIPMCVIVIGYLIYIFAKNKITEKY